MAQRNRLCPTIIPPPLIVLLGACLVSSGRAAEPADAVDAIRNLGGSVRPMASDDSGLEVEFYVRGRNLMDEGLAHVAALPEVVSLNLRDTGITNAGLIHLKKLTKLRRLHLERTEIGDEGLAHLAGLTNLEYLNLYGTHVSDKGLEQLTGLKKLEQLYLWQTGVTDAGVAKLQEALPKLTIVQGVDLSKLAALAIQEREPPKPKVDLKWVATANRDDAPKSQNGPNVQILFENKSVQPVKLYWVSYDDQLQHYADLAPGATRQQNSYANNTWLITNNSDKPLGYFIVQPDDSRAVIPALN